MDTNEKIMEPSVLTLDTAPDIDTVCIHKDRFAELVRKETTLEILQRTYLELESYQIDAMLPILLGCKKGDGDAE